MQNVYIYSLLVEVLLHKNQLIITEQASLPSTPPAQRNDLRFKKKFAYFVGLACLIKFSHLSWLTTFTSTSFCFWTGTPLKISDPNPAVKHLQEKILNRTKLNIYLKIKVLKYFL